MSIQRCAFLLTVLAMVLGVAPAAHAHGLIGKRFLPATLTIDDPFVADELSLPTISHIKTRAQEERPATHETDLSGEFSKRLSPNLGASLGGRWELLDREHKAVVSGFDNMEVALKYVFFKSPEHETLLSLGVGWDVGGTGREKVGAESFDTATPQLFFGKGLGDLPDSLEWVKPFALTGAFGFAMPTRLRTKRVEVTPDGDVEIHHELNPQVVRWGFTVQYSLQYLQAFVRDVGLPKPFNRMVPIVEFAMQTPIDGPQASHTTGTINPGIIWFGRYIQLSVEAEVPVNRLTGKNVGIRGQLHFFLDDIAPHIFSWAPFQGILGPTFPR